MIFSIMISNFLKTKFFLFLNRVDLVILSVFGSIRTVFRPDTKKMVYKNWFIKMLKKKLAIITHYKINNIMLCYVEIFGNIQLELYERKVIKYS